MRALSLMRIGVGFILLTDLLIRSSSIIAFFTDDGVLPISILKNFNWNPYYFSFHALSGELWWQIMLFILNTICISLFLIGYRTRFFTFVCWVFLVSLQNRNPFILQGGDDLLRLILLWGIFLPWGERYSVKKVSHFSNDYFSTANIGYILLIASVYHFSAWQKTSPEWHSEGTAIYYALSLDQLRMPLGTVLYQFPGLLRVLTFIVYHIELIAPLLILLPFLPNAFRVLGVLLILSLHIGIVSTLYVGLFYIIGIITLIGLLPSNFMDRFERHWFKDKSIIIEKQNNYSMLYQIVIMLKNSFIILVFSYCLLINLGYQKKFPYLIDPNMSKYGIMLRLEQNWGMFSPFILKDDGWFVYSGYSKKGKFIDIKHKSDSVSFAKPNNVVSEVESDRWRKFQENYVYNNNNYMRPYYCKYLINKWNREHPENYITDLTIFFIKETSLPYYQTKPIEKLALCNCQDK